MFYRTFLIIAMLFILAAIGYGRQAAAQSDNGAEPVETIEAQDHPHPRHAKLIPTATLVPKRICKDSIAILDTPRPSSGYPYFLENDCNFLLQEMNLSERAQPDSVRRQRHAQNRHINWSPDIPIDQWVGVETYGSGRVRALTEEGHMMWYGHLPDFGQLTDLRYLRVRGGEGVLHPDILLLNHLWFLDIDGNNFNGAPGLSGPLPLALESADQLRVLDLSRNTFTGTIPAGLGKLKKLRYLNLGYNQLSGNIPTELGNLSSLHDIRLNFNKLTGSIPESIGTITGLVFADFQYNHLTGCVPYGFHFIETLSSGQLQSGQRNRYSMPDCPKPTATPTATPESKASHVGKRDHSLYLPLVIL